MSKSFSFPNVGTCSKQTNICLLYTSKSCPRMHEKRGRTMKIKVSVPATSANVGSGFDALGLAVTLYNTVTLSLIHI